MSPDSPTPPKGRECTARWTMTSLAVTPPLDVSAIIFLITYMETQLLALPSCPGDAQSPSYPEGLCPGATRTKLVETGPQSLSPATLCSCQTSHGQQYKVNNSSYDHEQGTVLSPHSKLSVLVLRDKAKGALRG